MDNPGLRAGGSLDPREPLAIGRDRNVAIGGRPIQFIEKLADRLIPMILRA
jgi:hypothetical protein